MSFKAQSASLQQVASLQGTNIYRLNSPEFLNRFFILTSPGSRKLLSFPEVIGFPCYTALLEETSAALRYLLSTGLGGAFEILTILRGGLNYPLEEACAQVGIRVRDMHFLSCERVIQDHVITGLEIKYDKLSPSQSAILAIGDIIASGVTLQHCLDHFIKQFKQMGGSIRRIVFFTIGGTRAIELMEELTPKLRTLFPEFEGFDCFFYEGVFTVYDGPGVSGINVRDIDFGWQGGIVAPEFRNWVMDHPDALLEKCIIYDGGARRYEIPLHLDEVSEYWEGILERADRIDPKALVAEKLGYPHALNYEQWRAVTRVPEGWETLWEKEQAFLSGSATLDLKALARRRLESMESLGKLYK
ncbi:MAG: hypothetical protein IJP81_10690 [Bacteroidales bacterium]|nr:hypothetical protein [Bacteroidales bacterium]